MLLLPKMMLKTGKHGRARAHKMSKQHTAKQQKQPANACEKKVRITIYIDIYRYYFENCLHVRP